MRNSSKALTNMVTPNRNGTGHTPLREEYTMGEMIRPRTGVARKIKGVSGFPLNPFNLHQPHPIIKRRNTDPAAAQHIDELRPMMCPMSAELQHGFENMGFEWRTAEGDSDHTQRPLLVETRNIIIPFLSKLLPRGSQLRQTA